MAFEHPKNTLGELGLSAKKSFGQNFLCDVHYLSKTADAITRLKNNNSTIVFEIGAGLGALTNALLSKGNTVYAIERDRDLLPLLNKEFETVIAKNELKLFEADAVRFDLNEAAKETFVLCGNLPYHLSSQILFKTMDLAENIYGAVFLLQKEVVERIVSEPGNKTYGLLSVLLQTKFETVKLFDVPASAFWPSPKVDSSILCLTPKKDCPKVDWPNFVKLVKMAFHTRRKMLGNALSKWPNCKARLEAASIDSKERAENLSYEDFVRLSNTKE